MSLFELTAKDYLDLIGTWEDPNPEPIVECVYPGIYVVRDDLLEAGSKARAADYIIGHAPEFQNIKEWVYPSPATGYAQVSLAFVCRRYGKKAVIFNAARNQSKLTDFQKKGLQFGGEYHWVPFGMYSVVKKRATDYVNEDPTTRRFLPMGLNHPYAIASMIKVMQKLPIRPKTIWSVFSSGTISRCLQLAFPDAEVHAVHAGGHVGDTGRAIVHRTNLSFTQSIKKEEMPPFPSPANYDAKAWPVMLKYYEKTPMNYPILFWNVAA